MNVLSRHKSKRRYLAITTPAMRMPIMADSTRTLPTTMPITTAVLSAPDGADVVSLETATVVSTAVGVVTWSGLSVMFIVVFSVYSVRHNNTHSNNNIINYDEL